MRSERNTRKSNLLSRINVSYEYLHYSYRDDPQCTGAGTAVCAPLCGGDALMSALCGKGMSDVCHPVVEMTLMSATLL